MNRLPRQNVSVCDNSQFLRGLAQFFEQLRTRVRVCLRRAGICSISWKVIVEDGVRVFCRHTKVDVERLAAKVFVPTLAVSNEIRILVSPSKGHGVRVSHPTFKLAEQDRVDAVVVTVRAGFEDVFGTGTSPPSPHPRSTIS